MTATRAEILVEAREWIGTPFHHQGRIKGVGVDCVGLIYGVGQKFGLIDSDYTEYGREPHKNTLEREAVLRVDWLGDIEPQPADILLMRFLREPQHVAIFTGRNIIHAYSGIGKVVEHILDDKWRKRVVGVYGFRGVE